MNPIHNVVQGGGGQNITGFFSMWMVSDILAGLLYRHRVAATAELLKTQGAGVGAELFAQVEIQLTDYQVLAYDASISANYLAPSFANVAQETTSQSQTSGRRTA